MRRAPRRQLNPFLARRIKQSGTKQRNLAVLAGYTHEQALWTVLQEDRVRATPLTIRRLERIADAIGFPRDEIFLDMAKR